MSCSVLHCSNTRQNTGNSVFYHKFPTDEKLRKTWLALCGHDVDLQDCTDLSVCSVHFDDSDYEQEDVKAVAQGNSNLKSLKEDVIPHLNLLKIKEEPIDYDEEIETTTHFTERPRFSSPIRTYSRLSNQLSNSENNVEENGDGDSSVAERIRNLSGQMEVPGTMYVVTSSSSLVPPSSLPASQSWPGKYGFTVTFKNQEKSTKAIAWTFSEVKNKLYVGKDVPCPISFSTNSTLPDNVIIRAMALYTSPEQATEVVHRCFNHSIEELKKGLVEAEHLIRCESQMAKYDVDSRTGRHSVTIPFENPPVGQQYSTYIYKFACFGSCAGGPNRRPLMLIFTLEKDDQVIGRKKIDVKICACPGRDRKTEESQSTDDGVPLTTKRKEYNDFANLTDMLEFSKSHVFLPSKRLKSTPNKDGTYTISVTDRERYEFLKQMQFADKDSFDFLKQMKKFYDIYRMMKHIPPEVSNTLLHYQQKKGNLE